jgi:transposase
LFYQVSLDQLVPEDNFYRQLGKALDLGYLYKATAAYYGREGQQSIDPIVFFKILLVGYLNNINSDRALIRFCADRLGIRLFLGYDLHGYYGQSLPVFQRKVYHWLGRIVADIKLSVFLFA